MANIVEILLKAKDQASAEIRKVTGSLNELNQDGGKSSEGLGLDFDSLVGIITTGAAIAGTAIAAFKVAMDFSKEGAEIARVQDSSAMLAKSMGFDMDEIVAAVSAASLHTVSDMDIMASASKAMMLGVGSSAEEMASLMEVAAIRGRALGMDATEAFDQIVRGIGRLSPKILDNLGIIVDADVTYAEYAKSIGKAANELTEVEKRQALVNAVIADTAPLLAEAGGLPKDSASAWEEMSAAQKNYWDKMKSNASDLMVWWPEFWAAFYRAMTPPEKMEADVIDVMGKLNEARLAGIIDETTYNAVLGDVNNALMSNGEALAFVAEKTAEVRDANVKASNSYQTQLEKIWATSESYEGFLSSVAAAGIELNLIDEASWAAGKAEFALASTTNELAEAEFNAAVNASIAAGDYAALSEQLGITEQEAKKMIKAWEDSATAHAKMMAELDNVTSVTGTYQGIINLGYKYTDILEDIAEQETIMANNPIGSEKWTEANAKAEELKGTMKELANRVTLDMFQATIAVGGVTEAELAAYMQMAIDMGLMSEAGAQAAIEAYGNAIETINGYAIDDKTGNVSIDAVAAFLTLDLLQAYALKDKVAKAIFKVQWEYGQPGAWQDEHDLGHPANGQAIRAAAGVAASLPHYWVGELGPEPFFPAQNGRIVSNTQALAALRGGAGADSKEIADAVKKGVKEAMKEANGGNVYNLTMPTSSNPADIRMAFELMEAWGT